MAAKLLFAALAALFIIVAGIRIVRDRGQLLPASRTWLTIGIIFALVSAYLWTLK